MIKEELIDKDSYEIHDGGKIWSKHWRKYLIGKVEKDGYVQVHLKCVDGKCRLFLYHRANWYLLNGEIPEGYEINHLDENKQNNHILNLECVDHLTNIRHGTGIKRSAVKRINNPLTSKAVVAIDENGKIVYEFASISEAQRHGFYGGNVSQCCNKCFTREGNNYYKGYRWYYKEDYLNEKESE